MRTPQIAWLYLRYQIATKLLIGLVILPVFRVIRAVLFDATGQAFLSSGDIGTFVTSVTGWVFAIIALIFFLLVMGIDLFAFVRISEAVRIEKRRIPIREALISGIRSIRRFVSGWGIVVLAYIGVIMPLIGLGLTTQTTQNLAIPQFISSVVYDNWVYSAIYVVCFVALIWCGILHCFTLQGVIIDDMPAGAALRQSRQIMHHRSFPIVGRVLYNEAWMLLVVISCIAGVIFFTFCASSCLRIMHIISSDARIYTLMLTVVESVGVASFLITPWVVDILTRIYLNYTRTTERERLDRKTAHHQEFWAAIRYKSRFDSDRRIKWYRLKSQNRSKTIEAQGAREAQEAHELQDANKVHEPQEAHEVQEAHKTREAHKTPEPHLDSDAPSDKPSIKSLIRALYERARDHLINPFARGYRKTTLLICGALSVMLALNTLLAWAIDEDPSSFFAENNARIIAHRAGGDLGPENTIKGMQRAEIAGAQASEIDVQRTHDGAYVLFHDATAKRSADVDKKITDMTLDEIKKLQVKNPFDENAPREEVPTLEEYLDALSAIQKTEATSDDAEKMGVLIELKGKSADTQMADYVVSLIHENHLEQTAYVITLDYDLISYVEQTYPEITTGYLYYFTFGDITRADADILIMEEGVARDEVIEQLHAAGKQAYVWTINTPDAMERFALSNVDGIITDHVYQMMEIRRRLATADAWDRAFNWVFDALKWDSL